MTHDHSQETIFIYLFIHVTSKGLGQAELGAMEPRTDQTCVLRRTLPEDPNMETPHSPVQGQLRLLHRMVLGA